MHRPEYDCTMDRRRPSLNSVTAKNVTTMHSSPPLAKPSSAPACRSKLEVAGKFASAPAAATAPETVAEGLTGERLFFQTRSVVRLKLKDELAAPGSIVGRDLKAYPRKFSIRWRE